MKRKKKFPFSSYEEFEQNMMALENGEEKPIFEIISVRKNNIGEEKVFKNNCNQ